MMDLFEQEESTILYIDKIMGQYKRYARDQFVILEKSIQTYSKEREAAPAHCIKNGLLSSNDFRDVAAYLNQSSLGDIAKGIESRSSTVSSGIQVSTRSIGEYINILGGEINE